jgi:hypothetical protein
MTQICLNERSLLSAVAFALNFCIGAIIMPNPARNAGFGILSRPNEWNTVLASRYLSCRFPYTV